MTIREVLAAWERSEPPRCAGHYERRLTRMIEPLQVFIGLILGIDLGWTVRDHESEARRAASMTILNFDDQQGVTL
jgi:hypothetical protein